MFYYTTSLRIQKGILDDPPCPNFYQQHLPWILSLKYLTISMLNDNNDNDWCTFPGTEYCCSTINSTCLVAAQCQTIFVWKFYEGPWFRSFYIFGLFYKFFMQIDIFGSWWGACLTITITFNYIHRPRAQSLLL